MITVKGVARLKVPYSVKLNMTEEEFDNLSAAKQDRILEDAIDWQFACRSADTDEIEVDDVVEND